MATTAKVVHKNISVLLWRLCPWLQIKAVIFELFCHGAAMLSSICCLWCHNDMFLSLSPVVPAVYGGQYRPAPSEQPSGLYGPDPAGQKEPDPGRERADHQRCVSFLGPDCHHTGKPSLCLCPVTHYLSGKINNVCQGKETRVSAPNAVPLSIHGAVGITEWN